MPTTTPSIHPLNKQVQRSWPQDRGDDEDYDIARSSKRTRLMTSRLRSADTHTAVHSNDDSNEEIAINLRLTSNKRRLQVSEAYRRTSARWKDWVSA